MVVLALACEQRSAPHDGCLNVAECRRLQTSQQSPCADTFNPSTFINKIVKYQAQILREVFLQLKEFRTNVLGVVELHRSIRTHPAAIVQANVLCAVPLTPTGELEDALETALRAAGGVHRQLLELGLSCEDLGKSSVHLSLAAQEAPAEVIALGAAFPLLPC